MSTGTAVMAAVEKCQPLDFVTYEECKEKARAEVEKLPERVKTILGTAVLDFYVQFAAGVAWDCAAEATKRAKGTE